MNYLETLICDYLENCRTQKRLDEKTLKAYRIDLNHFSEHFSGSTITDISKEHLEIYIAGLHKQYKPKTVKRKIASVKALFHYLEYRDLLPQNPFNKLRIRFREPSILPKVIPLHTLELFLRTIYTQYATAKTECQKKNALRDAAIAEVLFATGMRISELCSLKKGDVNLYDGTFLIYGKGDKERRIQICNKNVIRLLEEYQNAFSSKSESYNNFFVNQTGNPLTDQAVRRMITKYSGIAGIELHITPHMFRHTFATSLLEQDVDIRYIQEMLGHSSINITEIYTHVAISKQRDILTTKHPRNNFNI